ncbi:MAG: hypothetical protein FJ044_00610 [Candidatus Cloacimonetes bacterium]|nr:hypothetical protein [Candidatus Cloacimonadota bacterium]
MFKNLWQKKESRHFTFYFFPHSFAAGNIGKIISERETAYQKISKFLGVDTPEKIRWYLFPSYEKGKELLGNLEPNQAIAATSTIFTIHSEHHQQTSGHELTHILSFYIDTTRTNSYKFLSEGLACYLDQSGKDYDCLAKELFDSNKIIPSKEIIDVNDFNKKDPKITYSQSASFVKFLIENYGLEKFKGLWVVKKNLKEEFQSIYQIEFEKIEKEWLEFLTGYQSRKNSRD